MSTLFRMTVAIWALYLALAAIPATAAAADALANRPGDDAMTCEQIAAELSPHAQQMMPNLQALASSDQQLYAEARQRGERRRAEEAMLLPLGTAGALDPTGASKRAYQAALMVQMAREKAENDVVANSPLVKENKAQTEELAAQGRQLQSNARLQRLMQLGQAKHCDKR
jgi:hypothetical protein